MADVTEVLGNTFVCKTCEAEFTMLEEATPVCCPLCRMNRVELK